MAPLVHRVVKWLPPAWQTAIERESREWRARCPKCLHETSIWDMGGVRFKAAGNPFRKLRCVNCSNSFLGQFYRVGATDTRPLVNVPTANYAVGVSVPTAIKKGWGTADVDATAKASTPRSSNCRLWIDGVGCFLVLTDDAITVGSPSTSAERPDVAIMAAISRRQVQIIRADEGYTLVPVGDTAANPGKRLRSGEAFGIGGGVEMRLRVPNPLSQTAVLEVASSHRVEPRCDGVILFDQVCVVGTGADAHIRRQWGSTPLVLFRRENALWCQEIPNLQKNGEAVLGEATLGNGDVLTTDDLSLRVELSCGS